MGDDVKWRKVGDNDLLMPSKPKKNSKRRRTPADYNATSVKTKMIADRMMRENKLTPLEVMQDNMQFFHETATQLTDALIECLSRDGEIDDDAKSKLDELHISPDPAGLFIASLRFRKSAQACAVDAAPYMHPKLATVSHVGEVEKPVVVQVRRIIVDPKRIESK